jgi:hypothetical protein
VLSYWTSRQPYIIDVSAEPEISISPGIFP